MTDNGYAGTMGSSMQYIQKDSWSDNNYDWEGNGWNTYYGLLRTNKLAMERSIELGLEFHEGVTMVMRALLFAQLTDFYGDVPYSEALKGDEPGLAFLAKYDAQENVYKGIIADLRAAAVLLSKPTSEYSDINPIQDVYFQGDPDKWMKFANSLALRYYMRLSEKLPSFAENGVKEMLQLPLINTVDEECVLPFIGSSGSDSWPNNGQQGSFSQFSRVKPSATLRDVLQDLEDPRMALWFAMVQIPIQVVPAGDVPGGGDDVFDDGVRYINEDIVFPWDPTSNLKIYDSETWIQDREDGFVLIDTNQEYVGIPVAVFNVDPFIYNLNPAPQRGGDNVHVSLMNETFNAASGPNLKARVMSAAEVHFLRAEAAFRGWGSNAEGHYNAGIQASFISWGIGDTFAAYIGGHEVEYEGELAQIMQQKWIANFGNAEQAFLDWRRTGLPDFKAGPAALKDVIPVRYLYEELDIRINSDNYKAALPSLEETQFSRFGPDDTYSKPWVIQGTGKPW